MQGGKKKEKKKTNYWGTEFQLGESQSESKVKKKKLRTYLV